MKLKNVISVLFFSFLLCFLPSKAVTLLPAATLTVDGMLVGNYSSVQQALDRVAATKGKNFIVEIAEGTVLDPINILQQPNKNIVLRPQSGATVVFKNTITVDGNGNLNSSETLLIQGFTFDFTSGRFANCIDLNSIPTRVGLSYSHNVALNGCTFKGIFGATVAVQSAPGGSRNISITNCTATNMHSLAQLKAVSGYAAIQNCTVSNAGSGVNFHGAGDLMVDGCRFDVEGYAVRSGQSAGIISGIGSVIINNSVLTSSSADVGTVVLRGNSANNINIVHSNITNTSPTGAAIQNLNMAGVGLYKIGIAESNLSGQVNGIDTLTITTTDDPNVQNGPVCITNNENDDDPNDTLILAIMIVAIIILFVLIIIFRRRWAAF